MMQEALLLEKKEEAAEEVLYSYVQRAEKSILGAAKDECSKRGYDPDSVKMVVAEVEEVPIGGAVCKAVAKVFVSPWARLEVFFRELFKKTIPGEKFFFSRSCPRGTPVVYRVYTF